MRIVDVQNVNDAYVEGLRYLRSHGAEEDSRVGRVLVAPGPVATVYSAPLRRVLFDPVRDANPFFHLFEALHMLSGRNDARWLDRFVGDFSKRFAEEGGTQHGAYGFRWRNHFDMEGGGNPNLPDQLNTIVRQLKANPKDRRCVLTMWDPVADLGAQKRDLPCNTNIFFRVRTEIEAVGASPAYGMGGAHQEPVDYLDVMVNCRSNDAIMGAYGANAVHMSVLLEYMAGRIGVLPGTYTQNSFNFHAYIKDLLKVGIPSAYGAYPGTSPMGKNWDVWDRDLRDFMEWTESDEPDQEPCEYPDNPWFHQTAEPLFVAHHLWKQGEREHALEIVNNDDHGIAPDWQRAAREWMERRLARMSGKVEEVL